VENFSTFIKCMCVSCFHPWPLTLQLPGCYLPWGR
jgi:hypothetical protein